MKTLKELILILQEIERNESIKSVKRNGVTYVDTPNALVIRAEQLAVSMISGPGIPSWICTLLEREGFIVRAEESDTFGWVTGVIETSKGLITFGRNKYIE